MQIAGWLWAIWQADVPSRELADATVLGGLRHQKQLNQHLKNAQGTKSNHLITKFKLTITFEAENGLVLCQSRNLDKKP